jgi:sn-glycerol 3-phosphate transport system substrate-binding protein
MAIDISADESWQLMEQFSAIHNQPIATKNGGYDGLMPSWSSIRPCSCAMSVAEAPVRRRAGQDQIAAIGEDYRGLAWASQMTLTSVGDHGSITCTGET